MLRHYPDQSLFTSKSRKRQKDVVLIWQNGSAFLEGTGRDQPHLRGDFTVRIQVEGGEIVSRYEVAMKFVVENEKLRLVSLETKPGEPGKQ